MTTTVLLKERAVVAKDDLIFWRDGLVDTAGSVHPWTFTVRKLTPIKAKIFILRWRLLCWTSFQIKRLCWDILRAL